jgi:hypothetical protein
MVRTPCCRFVKHKAIAASLSCSFVTQKLRFNPPLIMSDTKRQRDANAASPSKQLKLSSMFASTQTTQSKSSATRVSDGESWTELGKGSLIGYWPRALGRAEQDRAFQVCANQVALARCAQTSF